MQCNSIARIGKIIIVVDFAIFWLHLNLKLPSTEHLFALRLFLCCSSLFLALPHAQKLGGY